MSFSNNKHLPEIDGLRAVAVLSVVFYHANLPGFSSGFLGVDIFFVISGYLITGLLFEEIKLTGSIDFRAFYARRIRRLLPALASVLAIVMLSGCIFLFPAELPRLAKSATAVVLMVSNLHFMKYSGGYFDPSVDVMPLLHTWSLSVEEQFYLFWPLLMTGCLMVSRQFRCLPKRLLAIVLGLSIIVSFSFWMANYSSNPNVAFYAMPSRIWELSMGGILNFFPEFTQRSRQASAGRHISTLALSVLLASLCLPYEGETVAMFRYPLAVLASSLLILTIRQNNTSLAVQSFLNNRLAIFIGLISYSLYLWHWPLLALTRAYNLGERLLLRDLTIIAISLAFAVLSYRYLETPIRRKRPWPFSTDWQAIITALSIIVGLSILAHTVKEWGKGRNAELNREIQGIASTSGTKRCDEPINGRSLGPQDNCTDGASHGPIQIIVWGDSHAGHLARMLHPLSILHNSRFLTRSFGACPPLLNATSAKKESIGFSCYYHNQSVIDEIRQLATKGLKSVVLVGRWNAYLALPETNPAAINSYALIDNIFQPDLSIQVGKPPLDHSGSLVTLEKRLRETIQELIKMNLKVMILAPVPESYFNAPHCLYYKSEIDCRFPRERVDERRNPTLEALNKAINGLERVQLIDPIDYFCDKKYCFVHKQDFTVYGDTDHLSDAMALHLGDQLGTTLEWLWK